MKHALSITALVAGWLSVCASTQFVLAQTPSTGTASRYASAPSFDDSNDSWGVEAQQYGPGSYGVNTLAPTTPTVGNWYADMPQGDSVAARATRKRFKEMRQSGMSDRRQSRFNQYDPRYYPTYGPSTFRDFFGQD